MNRILKSFAVALMLAAAPTALTISAVPAQAQAADASAAQVQGF